MHGAENVSSSQIEKILGVQFFNGTVEEAVRTMVEERGLLVVPAAPALVNIQYDAAYREALVRADVAIADSGAMVLLWRWLKHRSVTRISGLAYLKHLLAAEELRQPANLLLVVPTASAREKAVGWLRSRGLAVSNADCYEAPRYRSGRIDDEQLMARAEAQRPNHIVIAIGGGAQERLGLGLRDNLTYKPAIHCIGAALGFLTGDQHGIPDWADKLYLGWLLRLLRNPRLYLRRFWVAHELPGLIATYGSELPPLRTGGSNL